MTKLCDFKRDNPTALAWLKKQEHVVLTAKRLSAWRWSLALAAVCDTSLASPPTHGSQVGSDLANLVATDFMEQNEDNTGRRTNNPDGLPPCPD